MIFFGSSFLLTIGFFGGFEWIEYGKTFGSWDCEGSRVVWWDVVCEFDP